MDEVEIELTIWDELRELFANRWGDILINIIEIAIQLVLFTILFLIARYLINNLVTDKISQKLSRGSKTASKQRVSTITYLLKNGLNYALYFIYAYIILSIFGFPIGTLIASAGIAGIALGFGAQEFVTDVINGFFIILENHFEVGDFVSLPEKNLSGTIYRVGIRSTIIQAASGFLYYIPNSEIRLVMNQSRHDISVLIDLPIDDESQINKIIEIVKVETAKLYEDYHDLITDKPTINGIVRGENQTFNYRVTFSVVNGKQYQLTSVFYQAFLMAFQEQNIKFPTSSFNS
ncbi:mechanosensitive ion channel family protein [Fundicoccus culcitae]|uniref:Mechanosensitive ion channel family protein n=1 Tax=Fundicoccus culcitae TaxID=2969821 RepID=A0ABY5P6K4_9LACT|nr:mechanosensitive ion channel family protein [Fundicoccus culcitae]UUX34374.1 mechanosensitive ion channel family protein [Fundicoccus culcitae]